MKQIKLVVCDIDGTIIDDNRIFSNNNREAFKMLKDARIRIGLASGRPLDELTLKKDLWDLDFDFDVFIGMNGSELLDNLTGTTDEYFLLEKEWIKEINNKLINEGLNPFIYDHGKILGLRKDELLEKSAASSEKEIVVAESPDDFYRERNAKILVRVPKEKMHDYELYYQKECKDKSYKAFKTQPNLLEFAHKDVSKAYALIKYCEHNNISLNEVCSFGDTSNDNEMLKVSKYLKHLRLNVGLMNTNRTTAHLNTV